MNYSLDSIRKTVMAEGPMTKVEKEAARAYDAAWMKAHNERFAAWKLRQAARIARG